MGNMLNIVEVKMTFENNKIIGHEINQYLNFENMLEAKETFPEIITNKSDIKYVTKKHADEMKSKKERYDISIFFREPHTQQMKDIEEYVRIRNQRWKQRIDMIIDMYGKFIAE